jgi:hypothetical protein
LLVVLNTGLHVFQTVRFFADVRQQADSDVPTLQQADCLLPAGLALHVGAFRLRMVFVSRQYG